eukprot:6465342-Amphidinium_carterae.1
MDPLDIQLRFKWPDIRSKLTREFLPTREEALCFMRARALPLLQAEPLARRYSTHKFIDQSLVASKRLAKLAPAAGVAFA